MPSIPQSLLWISLVVLWLFVLVPMLVSKRDAVRRTSDVALATRVLNSARAARLIKRGGPAAGHRSDPDWQPEEDEYDDDLDDVDDETEDASPSRVVTVSAAAVEETAPDHLDFDAVDPDPEVLPVSASAEVHEETVAETDTEVNLEVEYDDEGEAFDDDADQYEYIDDTSGISIGAEPLRTATPAFDRRYRYDADKAAAAAARKYAARKRVLMVMALTLVLSAATAFLLTSTAWWFVGTVSAATVLYLGYLRRQTRIEERVQRRRMQRMARSQLGVENTYDREYDVVPSRLRRPGAVVLEIDDEDPIFEHLDYAPYADQRYDWDRVLPRAVGQ
ncbi:MAG TPA: gephyrin-like molybdotransferase receptor GlpR [Mycobacterium sp.]|uniref:divisome protein SepX/GlpR n=1 Tax=Mycobacterium sp. TaxID=1785 RepID=UPI002BB40ECD|nr:gephyrin-like molybdotransferase receptor GlpR [Mycobacterium sp.]HXO80400.1 gephyrin-like molybdotransferase receptor GlpR [Mycobacterium sp.]